MNISAGTIKPDENIVVKFIVKNTGKVKGDEVRSVAPIRKILRGFERVSLNPGETKKVQFTLSPVDLCILNKQMKWVVEPGKFKVLVGSSSKDTDHTILLRSSKIMHTI